MSDASPLKIGSCQAIGFLLTRDLDRGAMQRADVGLNKTLGYFSWLNRAEIKMGDTRLITWGHGEVEKLIFELNDGGRAVLVGSPYGDVSLGAIEDYIEGWECGNNPEPKWDGRYLLIHIAECGNSWSVWNDWLGSVPVFHTHHKGGVIASSLEPVVVEACGFTPEDFDQAGLGGMLLNGYFVNDVTLYKQMKTLEADCFGQWFEDEFCQKGLETLEASDMYFGEGWDGLCDMLYSLTKDLMTQNFKLSDRWTLPLSAGIDSRLIAAYGAEMQVDFEAFTYGPENWVESIYAKKVADTLDIPWRRIDMGSGYLADYTKQWSEWFGSGMHFHGMYQMPYLENTKDVKRPIMTGFIGDVFAGEQIQKLGKDEGTALDCMLRHESMWDKQGVELLMGDLGRGVIEAVECEYQRSYDDCGGEHYQKMWLVLMRSRMKGFTSYQPLMYDYFQGVSTPFMNRKMAKFTLGLPRVLLEGRRLQAEMIRRYFPEMAQIPGTYANFPYQESGKYLMKRRIAEKLPRVLRIGPLKEFVARGNNSDGNSVLAGGKKSLWPMYESKEVLSEIFDWSVIEQVLNRALSGEQAVTNKYRVLQTLGYRMLDKQKNVYLNVA